MSDDDDFDSIDGSDMDEFIHFLGATVLAGMMAEGMAVSVNGGHEVPLTNGQTPEQFVEKMFNQGKQMLQADGHLSPLIITFKQGKVRPFIVNGNVQGGAITKILDSIVKKLTPDACATVSECWQSNRKDVAPSEDPMAREVLMAIYKDRSKSWALEQGFHHDEAEHTRIIFDGEPADTRKDPEEVQIANLPRRLPDDPTRAYIG